MTQRPAPWPRLREADDRLVHAVRGIGPRGHLLLALLGFAVLGTGVSTAYWTGSGSGTVAAATAVTLTTVTATPSATSLLYPNGPAADLTLTVRNPNPYAVSVTSVTAGGAATAAGGVGTCTTTGVSFVAPSAGLPFTVPAHSGGVDGEVTVVLTAAVQMTDASDTGCQGATFTVPVQLAGQGV